jgi:peptidyl-prolyl cis-trans isomerase D
VERLVYPSDAEAAEAKALFDQGISFEKLVADRGLTLNDIDLGDVSKDDLGAAGEAVFALTEPGLVGPVQSDLGPALFRMNGILAAEETTFDEARTALAMEMQTDAARRLIADKVETIDDLLASGAEVKDLATEAGMTVATIDYVAGGSSDVAIAGYPAFREAADAVAAGDFPEAISLDDGGLVALQLDEILPPAPIPFEDAREDVAQKWRADALAAALAARAAEIKTAVEGGASIGSFGIVSVTPELSRQGRIEGAPAEAVAALFKAAEGAVEVFAADEATFVIRLDKIIPAAATGDDATALRDAITVQTQQAIATDAFEAFTAAISAEAGISLDQTAITAVNAQFQ